MRGTVLGALLAALSCGSAACGSSPAPVQSPVQTEENAILRHVDLGHSLSEADPTWSGGAGYARTAVATAEKDGYAAGRIDVLEHFGTHVDAPSHFAANALTVDQLTPQQLIRPGVCLNVTGQVAANEDYAVTVDDIAAFESVHGRIRPGTVVLIATGWDSRWPDPVKYMNLRNGVKHFPGLSLEAAKALVDRMVAGIGIDTPSVDVGTSTTFEVHGWTMSKGLYHIENGARFTELPAKDFTVSVAPVKIRGGSGAPTRVFASFRDPNQVSRLP